MDLIKNFYSKLLQQKNSEKNDQLDDLSNFSCSNVKSVSNDQDMKKTIFKVEKMKWVDELISHHCATIKLISVLFSKWHSSSSIIICDLSKNRDI